jgi:hypothetical protein
VWEWNEAIVSEDATYTYRGKRGSSFIYDNYSALQASYRYTGTTPPVENINIGFRVVQVVPEPPSILALAGGVASLIGMRRRKRG